MAVLVCSGFCVYEVVQKHLYSVPHYLTGRYVYRKLEAKLHLFKQAASTKNLTIVSVLLLAMPWLYLFMEPTFKEAIQVIVAIYSPIITGLTMYMLYRQLRLMAALSIKQEGREERQRRLDFAKYWYSELKEYFNNEKVVDDFYEHVKKYSNRNYRESKDVKSLDLAFSEDKGFMLVNQIYLLLLQLRQGTSQLDKQAYSQVLGMAYLLLPASVWLEFERAIALHRGSSLITLDNCVFLTKDDFN
ncbi:hypothetical protein [Vibrio parahaemolyticus]|uniref:hypothetical protein n=1 Tax=Vibrio parahaemolyticus TaxID=670 RepID=UPI0011236546|nr:hypothetical protein [Vibrio parahaemolyticus]